MRLGLFRNSFLERLPRPRWPVLKWTAVLTVTVAVAVAVASFTPEVAFVSAVSPLDSPSQNLCFLAALFERSGMDTEVPPIFAAAIVASSAFFVKALGLWEAEDG